MRQRPSLFNYGTPNLQANPSRLCEKIDADPAVTQVVTVVDPLPVFGSTDLRLDYCFQLTKLEIDFHPGGIFDLPPELSPPLARQRFALHARVCGGMACTPESLRATLPTPAFDLGRFGVRSHARRIGSAKSRAIRSLGEARLREVGLIVPSLTLADLCGRIPGQGPIPSDGLDCFCIDLFATCHADVTGLAGSQRLQLMVDDVELVDVKPDGLEDIIECYLLLFVDKVLLPNVTAAASEAMFAPIDLGKLAQMTVAASTAVPNNPAVEEDQLKAFIDLQSIGPIPEEEPGPSEPGGASSEPSEPSAPAAPPPPLTRTIRPRTRTGPPHLTAAISEDAFRQIFGAIRDNFTQDFSPSGSFGLFTASLLATASLENGTVDFRSDGTIRVKELDVKWDRLILTLGIDIPEICVGGFCILPNPFDDCVRVPQKCVFSGGLDIIFPLDLSGLLRSEISVTAHPKVYYGVDSPNRWQVFLEPTIPIDIDIIDVADTVGDLLETAADTAIDAILWGLPGWAQDAIHAIIGSAIDLLRGILDLPDDIGEWIADVLNINLGLINSLGFALAYNFANKTPVFELEDPYTVMPATDSLIPVKIPIEYLGVRVNADEMVLEGDVGA